jgi:predicted transcriptional regulator
MWLFENFLMKIMDLSPELTVKQKVIAMLRQLPDDVELDAIEYHIYVLRKILNGLNDYDNGRVLTHDEVMKKFNIRSK